MPLSLFSEVKSPRACFFALLVLARFIHLFYHFFYPRVYKFNCDQTTRSNCLLPQDFCCARNPHLVTPARWPDLRLPIIPGSYLTQPVTHGNTKKRKKKEKKKKRGRRRRGEEGGRGGREREEEEEEEEKDHSWCWSCYCYSKVAFLLTRRCPSLPHSVPTLSFSQKLEWHHSHWLALSVLL